MPFTIVDEREGAYRARDFKHVVVDTEARPGNTDFEALAKGCDLLVIPTVPASLDTDVLILTLGAVMRLAPDRYRVLLTKVPPPPETDGTQLRAELQAQGIPLFTADIPRLKSFEKAASQGVTVKDVQDIRAERAWTAYRTAAEEITDGRK
jgi:chromosome partitioning protein